MQYCEGELDIYEVNVIADLIDTKQKQEMIGYWRAVVNRRAKSSHDFNILTD